MLRSAFTAFHSKFLSSPAASHVSEAFNIGRVLRSINVPRALGASALLAGTQHVHSAHAAFAASSAAGAAAIHSFASASVTGGAALAAFSEMGIAGWLLVDLAIQWGGWAVSSLLKTEKFYDLLGTGSFVALAAGSLALNPPLTARKILVSAMVGVWGLRLGTYLVHRVHKVGKDSRFDEVKHKPGTFLIYWTLQAVWVWVTLLPVLFINTSPAAAPLRWWDMAGVALWGVGLGFEAVADAQKDAWRDKAENKGKFINTGLWSISRHPNYLGEMTLWWGVFFTCAGGFSSLKHISAVASPLLVMFLLRFMSGVPILEKQADARWGGQPEYEEYKANTPVLVPDLFKLLGGVSADKATR